jgi:hypothetical protein
MTVCVLTAWACLRTCPNMGASLPAHQCVEMSRPGTLTCTWHALISPLSTPVDGAAYYIYMLPFVPERCKDNGASQRKSLKNVFMYRAEVVGLYRNTHVAVLKLKLKLKLIYDRRSVGQSILVSGSHLEPMTRFLFSVWLLWVSWCVAPSLTRGRVCNLLYNSF